MRVNVLGPIRHMIRRDISRVATVLLRVEGEWKYKVRVKCLHISQRPSVINCLLHTAIAQLNAYQVSSVEYFNHFNHFNDGSYDYVILRQYACPVCSV